MKNELEESKEVMAHKIVDSFLSKEQGIANSLNLFFQNKKRSRNIILVLVFIVFLILNLLSFKYL
jgi:hypothetical protein